MRLTVPNGGTLAEANIFTERQKNWIRTRLERLPIIVAFKDGAEIPLRGEMHRISHRPRQTQIQRRGPRRPQGRVVWITETDTDSLPHLCVSGAKTHLPRRLRDWLKIEAERDISHHAWDFAKQLGVTVKRISIRDQSTRWGSCSATGVLSFSWRMILAPDYVLQYLAAHEVAHLREMNHGPGFWAITHDLCPDTARAKSWLNIHGRDLHGIGG